MDAYGAATPIDSAASASLYRDKPMQWTTEHRIRATCERFAVAWSVGAIDRLASLLAASCDHVMLSGTSHARSGRAELIERFAAAFARRGPDFSIRMHPSLVSIRLLGDCLAILDGQLHYTSGIGAGGELQGRRLQPFSALVTETDGEWLILSIRVGVAVRTEAPLPA
jgi:uncharacterized protein (TIGR02246 family)